MIVVDTDVVSELMKPSPSAAVTDWVLAQSARELFTTSITLAEILCGIERLPGGRRKELLRTTAQDVFDAFGDQVLPFDRRAGRALLVGRRHPGSSRPSDRWFRRTDRFHLSNPRCGVGDAQRQGLRAHRCRRCRSVAAMTFGRSGSPSPFCEHGFEEVGGESHGWASRSR